MKNNLIKGIRMTVVLVVLFTVIYPLSVWAVAQLAPNNGKGEIVSYKQTKGYANIGQSFTKDEYFWGRPSAVDYNAAGSGASNKGASNEEYLAVVQGRIDTFLLKNPSVKKSEIPVDLVTASGSGLDPNISVASAKIQIVRIQKARNIDPEKLNTLIDANTEQPLLEMFGPAKINVLKLNIALDQLK
ncbi:K(+)-transporting ATPase subunit C [Flavobacterium sp. P4023]|uniref:Potassium-transporting ATPase KdpC subunit n=1 Tax=Flavobacterium flabelliforme TaxID=2816119 RepID=A0ABS5CV32_9FLAO|nr:K(+)-transporting ATPase subunit C [Flavobacterium flabelliforme]MBP4142486.1 K(+)-transporting ATPase subunit C [Flavobacterium flabelliforme]